MTTDTAARSPGLQAALDAKREADARFYAHCGHCPSCVGLLCPGGERLNGACDAALDALKAEIGR